MALALHCSNKFSKASSVTVTANKKNGLTAEKRKVTVQAFSLLVYSCPPYITKRCWLSFFHFIMQRRWLFLAVSIAAGSCPPNTVATLPLQHRLGHSGICDDVTPQVVNADTNPSTGTVSLRFLRQNERKKALSCVSQTFTSSASLPLPFNVNRSMIENPHVFVA